MIQTIVWIAAVGLVVLSTFVYGPWGPVARWRRRRAYHRAVRVLIRSTNQASVTLGLALMGVAQKAVKAAADVAESMRRLEAILDVDDEHDPAFD